MSGLKVCLKRQAVTPGCGVSKAFLNAQALLFGGYKDALQGNQVKHFSKKLWNLTPKNNHRREKWSKKLNLIHITCLTALMRRDSRSGEWGNFSVSLKEGEMDFSEELFLDHKSSTMRLFLQSAVHLQFFKQVWVSCCPLLDNLYIYYKWEAFEGKSKTCNA